MRIGKFQPCSLEAYPGKLAAVVMTQGCPWRCSYCRGAQFVLPEKFGPTISVERVLAALEKRRDRLQGLVVTGGEPTMHDDLPDFLTEVRALDLSVRLETNGFRPRMLETLLQRELVDELIMDVKAPLENYALVTGRRIELEDIRSSIWLIMNSGLPYEFRTTVVPGLHTLNELKAIGNLIKGAAVYRVQMYDADNAMRTDFRGRAPFPAKTLRDLERYYKSRIGKYIIDSAIATDPAEEPPQEAHATPEMEVAAAS